MKYRVIAALWFLITMIAVAHNLLDEPTSPLYKETREVRHIVFSLLCFSVAVWAFVFGFLFVPKTSPNVLVAVAAGSAVYMLTPATMLVLTPMLVFVLDQSIPAGNVVVWGVSFVIIFAFIVYGVLTPFLLLVGSLAGSSLWVIYKVATKLGEKYIA